MKKIIAPKEATSILFLPECWLLEDGKVVHLKDCIRQRNLPMVEKQYAQILEDLKLSFREVEDSDSYLEYWNPRCYREEEKTLPLYTKKGVRLVYSGSFTKKVQKEDMLNAAYQISEMVKRKIKEKEDAEKEAAKIQKMEKIKARLISGEVDGVGFQIDEAWEFGLEDIKVFKVIGLMGKRYFETDYYAVFNLKTIAEKKVITLEVPKFEEELYLTNKKDNLIYWSKELGVKFIHVVESETS